MQQDVLPFPDVNAYAVNNREDLDRALADLGYLEAKEAHVKACFKRASLELAAEYQGKLKTKVGDAELSIEERKRAIEKAVEEYCKPRRAELLPSDRKSLDLTHGTVGWRKAKDKLRPVGPPAEASKTDLEKAEADWLTRIVDKVLPTLLKCLQKLALVSGRVKAYSLLSITLDWDKKRIMDGLECKQIDPKDLKKVGWEFVVGQDEFYWSAAKQQLATESKAA